MKFRSLAIAFSACTAFLAPQAAHAEWLEAKSKHFTVIGDVSEQTLRRRVERLERFDAVMRTVLPKPVEGNLPVLMVASGDEVRKLGHAPANVLAFFRPSPFGVLAVTPAETGSGGGLTAETVMFHEYVHHMLMGSLDDPMPRWMNEGLAELFMNSRIEPDGSVTLGLGNEARGYSLNRLGRWEVERLFESDIKPPSLADTDQLYAKGWLVLHYLIYSGKRPGQFGTFVGLLKKGVPQLDAAKQAFGDLGKFETELEFYRGRKALPAIRLAADKLPEIKAPTVRRLSEAEAEIMPLRFRSQIGVTFEEAGEVAAKARPIAAKYPNDAFVQRAVAEMEFDARNYPAADAAIDKALAANPGYVDAMAYKGLLLGARAKRDKDAALWRQARGWIVKANRAEPDNPFVLALYFDSFEAAGEAPNDAAINGMLRAITLQPSVQDLRVKAGLGLIGTGDLKTARLLMAPVAFAPHRKPDNPLAKLLGEMDKGADRAALVAKIEESKARPANMFAQPDPNAAKKEGEAGKDPKPKS